MRLNRLTIFAFACVVALGSGSTSEARGGKRPGIDGRVLFENGATAVGAFVQLVGPGTAVTTRTDSQGTFRFTKLAPGSYTAAAFVILPKPPPGVLLADFIGSVSVDLQRGERASVVIVLHPVP